MPSYRKNYHDVSYTNKQTISFLSRPIEEHEEIILTVVIRTMIKTYDLFDILYTDSIKTRTIYAYSLTETGQYESINEDKGLSSTAGSP